MKSGDAAKSATPESSVHKNNSGVESQFQLDGLREGVGKIEAVEEVDHRCDLQLVIEETAGGAPPRQVVPCCVVSGMGRLEPKVLLSCRRFGLAVRRYT